MSLVDIGVEHHFLPHLYGKLSRVKAGRHLIQHIHEYDHASHLVIGEAKVSTDGGQTWENHRAPSTLLIKAGIAHEVIAVSEILWWCVHITDETDINQIDDSLVDKSATPTIGEP